MVCLPTMGRHLGGPWPRPSGFPLWGNSRGRLRSTTLGPVGSRVRVLGQNDAGGDYSSPSPQTSPLVRTFGTLAYRSLLTGSLNIIVGPTYGPVSLCRMIM